MKRKVIILIGVTAIVLMIAALAIPALVDVNRYRPQIEARLEDQFGRKFSLGEMRLILIPLGFRVQNAVIAEAAEFESGRPFAQTATLDVRPELLPLLRGDVQIDSVELTRPSVEFVHNKQGVWNFATLTAKRKEDGKPVSIDQLKITDGQVAITDLQHNEPRTVYDHIDFSLRDFAPDKAFSIDGRAHIPGKGEQTIMLSGQAGPIQRDGVARTPFDGKFQLSEVSLDGLQRVLKLQALENSDAVLTGSGKIKNDQGIVAANGKLEARSPRVRGVDLGYPVTVDYDVQSNLNENTLQIQKADLHLGKTAVSLQGRIDAKPKPVVVDLNLTTPQASLGEAARLAAAFGVAFRADTQVDGVLNLNVHARGPLDNLVLDGKAGARALRISGGDLPQPVQVDAMEVSLTPHAIVSNEFTAATGRTQVRAQFTLSEYTSPMPQVKAAINTANAEVGELLNIAHGYGISAVQGVKGSGTVQLNVTVSGPLKQTDKLTYSGSGALRESTFDVSSLAKPLNVRNADLRFNANSVFLDNADFSLGETVARGNAVVRNPAAPSLEFSLAAGKINVAEWQALTQAKRVQPAQAAAPTASRTPQDSLIRRLTGSGHVTVDTVIYDQLVLTNVDATVRLDNGLITMNPVNASIYGGQQGGTVILNMRTEPATYSVNSKLQQVDANRLLSSVSPIKDGLYGTLSANADTRFTATSDAPSIARSLSGRVSLNLKDGAIANMDLLHQMAAMAKFFQSGKAVEPVTKVAQLTGDFDIKDGIARTNNLKATMEAGSFAATGLVDLGQQKLNLRVTAVLSKEYSDAVGGINIGGFMTTAIANQNGEIVVPMMITGTFQDPQFAPDLQKIAEMKLQQIVPTADNPAAAGVGLLNRILGRAKPEPSKEQPTTDQERKPQNVPDALDQIFGKLKKKPNQ